MRIEVRQEGGFAGLRRPPVVLETDELEPAVARRLEELAAGLPAGGPGGRDSIGADQMRYDVLVDDPGGRRSATFFEPDVPAEVRELLRLARDARRGKA
jgi:Emfourin